MATPSRVNLGVHNANAATLPNVNSGANDQFKATKIWNEILQSFYLGIELRKYRRNMKTYYDCFTASQAVDWLKTYLRQCDHFKDRKVTRFQALNLLRKYHKSSIIERVKASKDSKELQDNNELYRFSDSANENLPFLSASRSDADLLESCQIGLSTEVELNLNEKIAAFKSTVWERMLALQPNMADLMKPDTIDGTSLYNNITRVNENGVVQLADKAQDLPHWLISAMKCLANWPRASGSGNCLPKYPGFENDVFNLIREYFTNIEDPIIPFEYYPLLMSTFDSYLKETLSASRAEKLPSFLRCNSALLRETAHDVNLPSNCVYETAFSSREPVTKIVPINELSSAFPNLADYFQPINSSRQQNSLRASAFSPLNSMSMSTSGTFKAISTMPRNTLKSRAQQQQVSASTPQNSQMKSDILCLDSPPESGEYMLNKDMVQQRRFYSLHRNESRGTKGSNPMLVPSLPSKHYQLLQLLLFTLPSSNRRHLQLLLRLFHKIIRNKELCLLAKDSLALKEHIVDIFARCILRCLNETKYNELKAKEFVSFLIDECMNLFRLPDDFEKEIEKTLNNLKRQKGSDFCQKITTEEFEMQRDVMSEVALSELLESIMRDDSLSERDKLKWIKQFKMYHPDVYDVYFTNCSAKTTNERAPSRASVATRTRSLGATILQNAPNSKLVKRFLSLRF